MTRLVMILLLLFLAVYLGLQFNQDPGYVLIAVNHWTLETTLWFTLISILVIFVLLHSLLILTTKIGQIPTQIHTWQTKHRTKIAQEKTRQGLIEFSEGYWSKAKTHLIKALPNTETPLLNYLTAARAAQEMGDHQLRDLYLREAQQSMPEAQIAVELTQAQLQLANKQWEQALATLRHLQDMAPKHPYVLKLLMELYQEVRDWTALIQLFPELKKHHILTESALDALYQQAYRQSLHEIIKQHQPEKITTFINELPKSIRYNPEIMADYCQYLIQSNQPTLADELLRRCLDKKFNETLITLYGLVPCKNDQLTYAETFLKKHPNSSALYLCLGRLCIARQLWGKAKAYFEQSLLIEPSTACYAELGKLHETLNAPEEACHAYRAGLALIELKLD